MKGPGRQSKRRSGRRKGQQGPAAALASSFPRIRLGFPTPSTTFSSKKLLPLLVETLPEFPGCMRDSKMLWGTADKSVLAVDFHVCTCLGIIDLSSFHPPTLSRCHILSACLLEGLVLLHPGGIWKTDSGGGRSFSSATTRTYLSYYCSLLTGNPIRSGRVPCIVLDT